MKRVLNKGQLGFVILALLVILTITSTSDATIWTLTNNNSTVQIDPTSQSGMFSWSVDGIDHMFQQWFWYRTGSNPESSIDTLTLSNQTLIAPNILKLSYSNAKVAIDVTYVLTGGTIGSKTSDVGESIRIKNKTTSALDMHFFQYTDFDLGGTPNDDTAVRSNANTILQTDANGTYFSEVVATPQANHYEIAEYPTIKDLLNDTYPSTLSDSGGPVTGNVSFAWEWDRVLSAGGTLIISKDKIIDVNPVPEPATILLIGIGLVGTFVISRRK